MLTILAAKQTFSVMRGMVVLAAALFPSQALAWGPHTEIMRAALHSLSERARWHKYFGDEWDRLARDYCWMGDWREAVRPDHYADDYLLFPGMPTHFSHMHPEVRRTFEPYFKRALQALRTESPQNAARWLGSLMHFVQDSGSPPHTIGIGGTLHGNMERWVDETKIDLGDYRPRLLGNTDDAALRGFLERMDDLFAYSKKRALQLKPLVEGLKERVNQPLELECALEAARASADVMHTLLTIGLDGPPSSGGSLVGRLESQAPADYAKVPAKIALVGTTYSTTASPEGDFRFRDLPPGKYEVWLLATGCGAVRISDVLVRAAEETRLDRKLKPDGANGNLVRNPTFVMQWLAPGQPDWWRRDSERGDRWASALIRVPVGRRCIVAVDFHPGQTGKVSARWRTDPSQPNSGRTVALELTEKQGAGRVVAEIPYDRQLKPFEKDVLFLEVLIETPQQLSVICRHINVVFGEP